jgi:hypothetical protein
VASTCSSPPALASGCWGSGGDGSGSVVSSSGAGSSWAGGSRAGVAAAGFGLNLIAVPYLMKQNQLYYYTSRKVQDMLYARRIYTYSEDFFMIAFFILRVRDFSTSVLVAGGGVTPADCGVPATAMVTISVDVVDGSVPAVSAASSAGTSSSVNSVPTTFWRLGSGGEAEELGVRLHALYVCALPDDPKGPMAKLRSTPRIVRGSCSFSPSLHFSLSARGLSLSVVSSLG